MIKPYRQLRMETRAQAGFDLLIGLIKWAAILAFIIWWCEVPHVS